LNKNSVNRYLRFKFKSLARAYSGPLISIVVQCVCTAFAEGKNLRLSYIQEEKW